jgi:hypothetical protein
MAKQGQGGLEDFTGALARAGVKGPPPVERWKPPFCGDLDMRIAADGTWFYMKTPIGRQALVKLFASILKREGDKYFLVTPVEKCGINVDDAPFLAVELDAQGIAFCMAAIMGPVRTQRCPVRPHALRSHASAPRVLSLPGAILAPSGS